MRRLLCRLFGHDDSTASGRRICTRCGRREMLQRYGSVLAWQKDERGPERRSPAPQR